MIAGPLSHVNQFLPGEGSFPSTPWPTRASIHHHVSRFQHAASFQGKQPGISRPLRLPAKTLPAICFLSFLSGQTVSQLLRQPFPQLAPAPGHFLLRIPSGIFRSPLHNTGPAAGFSSPCTWGVKRPPVNCNPPSSSLTKGPLAKGGDPVSRILKASQKAYILPGPSPEPPGFPCPAAGITSSTVKIPVNALFQSQTLQSPPPPELKPRTFPLPACAAWSAKFPRTGSNRLSGKQFLQLQHPPSAGTADGQALIHLLPAFRQKPARPGDPLFWRKPEWESSWGSFHGHIFQAVAPTDRLRALQQGFVQFLHKKTLFPPT